MKKSVSIILPCRNEEKYIETCIESLINNQSEDFQLEILVVDGRSTDKTVEKLQPYIEKYSFIKLLHNPEKTTPFAMNLGIDCAKGDYIVRVDAHAHYPENYVATLITKLMELDADNVGALWKTDVLIKTNKTLAIKEVLSNRFGVGNAFFRIGVDMITEVDTVPFGCFNKDVFSKYGFYDTRLTRNQDIELNKRIIHGGGKIYLLPDIECVYYARETFSALAKNNYNNGLWNILTVKFTKKISALSLRHFVPLCFILSLITPLLLSVFLLPLFWVSVASLFLYLSFIKIICIQIACRKKLSFFYLLWSFVVLHFSYGAGSLIGIIKPAMCNK
ncbi:MAG: glycosyltransferase family 2 protein [Bacteroidales bacterium]|jgi:glycosyltransferase involved in cell wall biosynthesis|nr:glycosyltransferase family 2 protein [Bacteroidales bacterium]